MHITYLWKVVLSLSIFIAGIMGIVRFNQIGAIYKPFLYLVWVGCCNELLSIYLSFHGHYTIANNAIYDLCESLFLLWFFRRLGVLRKNSSLYILLIIFISAWLAEVLFVTHLTHTFSRYFNAIYYLFTVLVSIRAVNKLLFTEKELGKNPSFLICIGMIVFFTYGAISKMFWFFDVRMSSEFLSNMQSIFFVINFLTNLIYALAVLWMRKRQAFTLQF